MEFLNQRYIVWHSVSERHQLRDLLGFEDEFEFEDD